MPPETLSDLGVISLLPVALALVLSIASRNVILGLFIGLFTGVLLIEGFSPIAALTVMVRDYLVPVGGGAGDGSALQGHLRT